MTIIIQFSGGFGNNIQQYIIGCLISDIKNEDIKLIQHYHPISHIDSMTSIYKVINKERKIIINSKEKILKNKVSDMYFPFSFEEVYNVRNEILNNYFDWNIVKLPFNIEETDIVISVRLGMNNEVVANSPYLEEYPKGLRIPYKYYKEVLDKYKKNRKIICCDDFSNKFLDNFKEYGNVFWMKYNTLIQYKAMLFSNILISCHSSFSHTAMLLSNAKETYIFDIKDNGISIKSKEDFFELKKNK